MKKLTTFIITFIVAISSLGEEYGSYEITFSAAGATLKSDSSYFGLDVSLSTNPIKERPEIWFGIAQGIYWEPSFSGSTDVFADWSWNIYKDIISLNTGWSVGNVYDSKQQLWRTGPEACLQYYVGDNSFIYIGINYDFMQKGDNGIRYGFGIGLTF